MRGVSSGGVISLLQTCKQERGSFCMIRISVSMHGLRVVLSFKIPAACPLLIDRISHARDVRAKFRRTRGPVLQSPELSSSNSTTSLQNVYQEDAHSQIFTSRNTEVSDICSFRTFLSFS